jgi:hypothetical protein
LYSYRLTEYTCTLAEKVHVYYKDSESTDSTTVGAFPLGWSIALFSRNAGTTHKNNHIKKKMRQFTQ